MSNTLPKRLQHWQPWLYWFAPQLASALGDLLQRIAPFLGVPTAGAKSHPQPDGLGDVQRKGAYQHLLSSEWLLADEMPDEFLRRATSHEHLFLAPILRKSRIDQRIIAVFDVGPMQLGAPRLLHLVLWILLARRAQLAGAEILWGTLQTPGVLHAADSALQLKQLLAARSYQPARADDWVAWQSHIHTQRTAVGETWLISATQWGADSGCEPSHGLCVNRAADEKSLSLQLHTATQHKSLELPLADDPGYVSLLRGHFDGDPPPSANPSHRKSLTEFSKRIAPTFSADSRKIAVVVKGESALQWLTIPALGQPLTKKSKLLQWKKNSTAIACGFLNQAPWVLLRSENELQFMHPQSSFSVTAPPIDRFAIPPGTAVWQRAVHLTSFDKATQFFLVLDARAQLVFWSRERCQPASGPHLLADQVLALVQRDPYCLFYATRNASGALDIFRADGITQKPTLIGNLCEIPPQAKVLLCDAPARHSQMFEHIHCAVRLSNAMQCEVWQVYNADSMDWFSPLLISTEAPALGLVYDCEQGRRQLLLVLLADNKRSIALQGHEYYEKIYTAPCAIVKASFDAKTAMVALITEDAQLLVYSVPERALRLQISS